MEEVRTENRDYVVNRLKLSGFSSATCCMRRAGALDLNRDYLTIHILPHFVGRRSANIDRKGVRCSFASLRAAQVSTDWSMLVLCVFIRKARGMHFNPDISSPRRGIRPNRRERRVRSLSDTEIPHPLAVLRM